MVWQLSNVLPYVLWNWRPIEVDCVDPESPEIAIGAIKDLYVDNEHAENVIGRILATNDWSGSRTAIVCSTASSGSSNAALLPSFGIPVGGSGPSRN